MFEQILTCSRNQVKEISKNLHDRDKSHVIISITNDGMKHIALQNYDLGALLIKFADSTDINTSSYTEELAKTVAAFVNINHLGTGGNTNLPKVLLINCEAGLSRSVGMAQAISEYYNIRVSHKVQSLKVFPNLMVKKMTMEALGHKQRSAFGDIE